MANFLQGISFDQVTWTGYFTTTLYWIGIFFFVVLFVAIIWYFLYLGAFNIPLRMYDNINGVPRFLKNGKGRVVKGSDGVSKFKIFGFKGDASPPPDEFFQLSRKGRYLNLIKQGDTWSPFKVSVNPGHATLHDYDVRYWMSQSVGNIVRKYTELSFFQKYGTYIIFIFGILVLGWMYYILISQIGRHVDQEISIMEKVSQFTQGKIAGP